MDKRMDRSQKAVSYFNNGYNCSQAVFAAFAPELGVPENIALKIGCPFGAGMGRMQETCGAVTGAFMVIGLKCGKSNPGEEHLKQLSYELVNKFTEMFKSRNKTIKCRDLIDIDLSTKEGFERARELGIFDKLCVKFVRDAAEIVETIL
jgi:C_GCAxxG_C_C family probable redox protein